MKSTTFLEGYIVLFEEGYDHRYVSTREEAKSWALEYGALSVWRIQDDVPPREVTGEIAAMFFDDNPDSDGPPLFSEWAPTRQDEVAGWTGALRP